MQFKEALHASCTSWPPKQQVPALLHAAACCTQLECSSALAGLAATPAQCPAGLALSRLQCLCHPGTCQPGSGSAAQSTEIPPRSAHSSKYVDILCSSISPSAGVGAVVALMMCRMHAAQRPQVVQSVFVDQQLPAHPTSQLSLCLGSTRPDPSFAFKGQRKTSRRSVTYSSLFSSLLLTG